MSRIVAISIRHSATQSLIATVQSIGPGQARGLLITAIHQLQDSRRLSGPLAIIGLAGALWSASEYIGAFMRAANAIYDMPEGRPIWKIAPLRLAITLVLVVLLAACALGVVVTGTLADRVGRALGVGSAGVTVWGIAKWPVLVVVVSLAIAMLYWISPNVRQPGFAGSAPADCWRCWCGRPHAPDSPSTSRISVPTTRPTARSAL